MNKVRTQTNVPEDKLMTVHEVLHPKDDINYKYQENNEEEDSPELKIVWMYWY